jgi:hypothetical protein
LLDQAEMTQHRNEIGPTSAALDTSDFPGLKSHQAIGHSHAAAGMETHGNAPAQRVESALKL